MADPTITPEQIAEAASGAQEFTSDGNTAKAIPIKDQIEAAKFEAANARNPNGKRRTGIKLIRMIPPGAS